MSETKKRKLTREEKRLIREAVKRARGTGKYPATAQQTIPYQRMSPDGICRVGETLYSKTIRFEDINYQLSIQEEQETIFAAWKRFINSFDCSVQFQMAFYNLGIPQEEIEKGVTIPPQGDALDDIREEFSGILRSQLAKGNDSLQRLKTISFSVEAPAVKSARPRLERIEAELMANFKKVGVQAEPVDGKGRLALLHRIFHMDGQEPFHFDWDWLVPSGLRTQDFIAPSSFEFRDGRTFRIGERYCAASVIRIDANGLNDRCLKTFLEMDSILFTSIHIRAIDQAEAIRMVKHTITELDRSKIEEQKKAVRSGYDMDILPSDLTVYGPDAKKLLDKLMNQDEHLFFVTILFVCTGSTKKELASNLEQARRRAQAMSCALISLDFQQEQAMCACLPLAYNPIKIQRAMPTESVAILVPFMTQELFQTGAGALYCGLNALSNNMIMVDRQLLGNPNGMILGKSGSGKSFCGKREMTNVILVTRDDVIICDPESEYAPLVLRLGGQVIHISANSRDHINPMDISMDYNDEGDPLRLKSEFILSLCELMVGQDRLDSKGHSIIDNCLPKVYEKYFADPKPENMPVLGDLYDLLCQRSDPEAQYIAAAMERYVTGSLNVFNHRTTVNLNNRIVCYDIRELGNQLKQLGMLIVQDQVWNRVTTNRAAGKNTRYYVDEMHLLLREPQTAAHTVEIWKRFRKWGGIPTGITQNIKDLMNSKAVEIQNIFENSDYMVLLTQGPGDADILADLLNISRQELAYIKQGVPGEGLLCYGGTIVPFVDRFPKDTQLYQLMTTRFSETGKEAEPS